MRIFCVLAREEIPEERKISRKIRVNTIVFTRYGSRTENGMDGEAERGLLRALSGPAQQPHS